MVAVQAVPGRALPAAAVAALVRREREADKEARARPPVLVAPLSEAALRQAPSAAGPRLELSVVELRDPRRKPLHPPHLSLPQRHQAKIPRRAAG